MLAAGVLFAAQPVVRKTGQLRVNTHCEVDLDDGECVCMITLDGDASDPPAHPGGKEDDFRLEPDGSRLYLQPRHHAQFAMGSAAEAGFSGCSSAAYRKGRLRIDGLPAGRHICVRTNQGRFAELRIDEARPKADSVLLSYTTWESGRAARL